MSHDRENHFAPGKLWSLWDLMAVIKNEAIFRGLYFAMKMDSEWKLRVATPAHKFNAHQFEIFVEGLRAMHSALLEAGLPISAKHAIGIVEALQQTRIEADGSRIAENASRSWTEHHLDRLVSVFPDEAGTRLFVSVSAENVALYEPSDPLFGNSVNEVFGLATDDIVGAGKCIALGLGTAAVFHLMRVAEAGLKAIGKELDIPYASSWESYIKQLSSLTDGKNYGTLTPEQREKLPFYREVLGDLVAVKIAWRNPTMHIVKSYEASDAKKIYYAVEGFMRHLAEKLTPLAPEIISTGSMPVIYDKGGSTFIGFRPDDAES